MKGTMKSHNQPNRPVQVLSLGMPRTGSLSMATALTTLGYKDVFHSTLDDPPENWFFFEQAADAHFASLPSFNGKKFSREQWDTVFGPCEAITDLGATYAEEMVKNYPEAKVIIVRRDFDSWARSFDESITQSFFGFVPWLSCNFAEPLLGIRLTHAMRKQILGFIGVCTVQGARDRGAIRRKYDAYHEILARTVSPERRLECRLVDGWEPICKFLGKEVPAVPFPHVNDSASIKKGIRQFHYQVIRTAVVTRVIPVLVVGFAVLYTARFKVLGDI